MCVCIPFSRMPPLNSNMKQLIPSRHEIASIHTNAASLSTTVRIFHGRRKVPLGFPVMDGRLQ